ILPLYLHFFNPHGVSVRVNMLPEMLRILQGELRSEIKDGCRVVYPQQQDNQGTCYAVGTCRVYLAHVKTNGQLPQQKQKSGKSGAYGNVFPFDPRVWEHFENDTEKQGSDQKIHHRI